MVKNRRGVTTRCGVLGLLVAVGGAALVAALGPAATTATPNLATSVPQVIGPIASTAAPGDPSHNYVFYSTPMNLAKVGYEEQKYFIRGVATRYNTVSPNAASPIDEMPYETRIVVRRPTNPQRFGGVVVVDWQNVTAGHDIDTEWGGSGDFFVRHGWVWVGASVQRVGVNGATTGATANLGLKQWSRTRYGPLDLTNGGTVVDDSQSYDVYTQIARLVKQGPSSGPNPFAGLAVRDVYAGGVSQSATFLVRYYNALQSTAQAYDGFLVGLGGGVPRSDVGTKLMKVYTETDVLLSQAALRVPDSATIHTWEVTGGSHVPASAVSPDPTDFRATLGGIQTRGVRTRASRRLRQSGAERRRGVGGLPRRVCRARPLGDRGRAPGDRRPDPGCERGATRDARPRR
jgi:Alpha/beta hydrolase domain